MGLLSWATLTASKTKEALFTELTDTLKGIGFPVDDWNEGGAMRTALKVALAPALSKLWDAVASVAKGGLLRTAQALAEAEATGWASAPENTWLYVLATNFYGVALKRAGFTEGTMLFVNAGTEAQTITKAHVVSTTGGLKYTVNEAVDVPLPAGTSAYIKVKAQSPGSAYNVGQGSISVLNVSLPGVSVSNQPQAPATSWITTPGYDQETPQQLADRCAVRWGRLTKLLAIPADGYVSLALDAAAAVKKVAVWSNYSHAVGGFQRNTVTLYLGSDTAPVDAATAVDVGNKLRPYIGLHDVLESQPCGTQTMTITGTIFVSDPSVKDAVKAAVEAALVAYQKDLKIGQTVFAWKVRDLVGVAGVVNFVETLADFIPNKNALVSFNYAGLIYQVAV